MLESVRGELLVFTDNHAPNGRVVRIDPANPAPANWKVILAEKPDTIDSISVAGGKVIATYMKDGRRRLCAQHRRGARERDRPAGLGSVSGFNGRMDDSSLFYTYSSFNFPSTIFRYEVAARKSSVFRARSSPASTSISTRSSRCS